MGSWCGWENVALRFAGALCLVVVVICGPGSASAADGEGPQDASAQTADVSFVNDVVPIFSRYGCNAGSCHGAARGKDGFGLSLFGFDPAGDHETLVRELPGRRVDLSLPEQSLLLAKAAGQVTHTGGKLLDPSSSHYQQLLRWISEGAQFDGATAVKVASVNIWPTSAVLVGHGQSLDLNVSASYVDQSERDVGSLATFTSSNPSVAAVSPNGAVTAIGAGEAFVTARFEAHTVGLPVIVHLDDQPVDWPDDLDESNYIDAAIHAKLRRLRLVPSQICTDAEFLRRVMIDLAGALPTTEQLRAFVADDDLDKRAKLIDQLIDGPAFVRIWTLKWADLLRIRTTNKSSAKATWKFSRWLKTQFESNVPFEEILTQLVTAVGSDLENPASSFLRDVPNHKKVAEDVAQVFLGMRLQCAQCHNHPFDRWTMDDYYGFVAFFDQTRRKRGADPREWVIFTPGGRTVHPVTRKNVQPKYLGGEAPVVKGDDRRQVLAEWLTSPENPYVARNLANRIWAHFFATGIVNEVDDFRVSNPPVNESLLNELADHLIEAKFDYRSLARQICNSQAYQRSTLPSATNASDQTNFSRSVLRRIQAEVLLDVIAQVTETENDFAQLPKGASATELADGRYANHFLKTFGKSPRRTVCACEVNNQPTLSQALHLINGDTVHQKIVNGGVIKRLIADDASNEQIVNELYLRCLSRLPTMREWASLTQELDDSNDRQQSLEDIFWALLNSREFLFNH